MLSKHTPPRRNKIEKSPSTAISETRIALNASVVIDFDISLYTSRLIVPNPRGRPVLTIADLQVSICCLSFTRPQC